MTNQHTSNELVGIGKEIHDTVQKATSSRNYANLNQNVRQSVENMTLTQQMSEQTKARAKARELATQKPPMAGNFSSMDKKENAARTMKNLGTALMIPGIGFLVFVIGGAMMGFGISTEAAQQMAIQGIFPVALTAGGVFFRQRGLHRLGKIRRWHLYISALGTKEKCSIKELCVLSGKTSRVVEEDLRELVGEGLLPQAHLDFENGYIYTSDQSYEQALLPPKPVQKKKETATLPKESENYIKQIHTYNEWIKDEKVSEELDTMEKIVRSILEYVEEHPEKQDETEKMMKYYLPTTMNLLEAYRNLSEQPVQGENITKSKQEIEQTLSTINSAFARLFDSLYQDDSINISSEITVLNVLLAQQGLTEKRMKDKVEVK